MKKLMIAAAMAAMIGGVYADTAYTFKASLKTTKGKSGTSTVQYKLGKDDNGKFWYEDDEVVDAYTNGIYTSYFTLKKVGNSKVPAFTAAAKKDVLFLTEVVPVAILQDTYRNQSAGRWCESGSYKEEGCYRIAGTKKLSDTLETTNLCCSDLAGLDFAVNPTVELNNIQYFGALDERACKKVEMFAEVTGTGIQKMYIAGQGSLATITDNDLAGKIEKVTGVKSISGNAVAVLDAPECEYCCTDNDPAVAFECSVDVADTSLYTAAWGTFSISYNAKATKDL